MSVTDHLSLSSISSDEAPKDTVGFATTVAPHPYYPPCVDKGQMLVPLVYPRPLAHARMTGWMPPSICAQPIRELPVGEAALRHSALLIRTPDASTHTARTGLPCDQEKLSRTIVSNLMPRPQCNPTPPEFAQAWMLSETPNLLQGIHEHLEETLQIRKRPSVALELPNWVHSELKERLDANTSVLGKYETRYNAESDSTMSLYLLATTSQNTVSYTIQALTCHNLFCLAQADIQRCHIFYPFAGPYLLPFGAPEILEGLFLAICCNAAAIRIEERAVFRLIEDSEGFLSGFHCVEIHLVGLDTFDRVFWEHCAGYAVR